MPGESHVPAGACLRLLPPVPVAPLRYVELAPGPGRAVGGVGLFSRGGPGEPTPGGRVGADPVGVRRGKAGTKNRKSHRNRTTATSHHSHRTTRSNDHSSNPTTSASEAPSRSHEVLHGVEDCRERRARSASPSTGRSHPSHQAPQQNRRPDLPEPGRRGNQGGIPPTQRSQPVPAFPVRRRSTYNAPL